MPVDAAASSPSVSDLHRRVAEVEAENARLHAELRIAAQQEAATSEVLEVINLSSGDQTRVFETILKKAHALCGVAHGSLQLFDGENFHAVALHNVPNDVADRLRQGYKPGQYMPVRQLLEGAPFFHVHDLAEVDHPIARAAAPFVGTTLYLALRKDHRLLGQIVAAREEVRDFSDKEIALLQYFGQQAVIAMENARLLGEQREALEQQTATAEVLQVINSSPGKLDPVFDAMLEKAMRLCEASFGGLTSYDGERFHTLALRGLSADAAEAFREPWKAGPGSYHENLVRGEPLVHADLAVNDAARRAQPQSSALAEIGGARSGLLVALRKEDALRGSLWFYRKEVRPFTEKQIVLLKNFADQAVIAMENARLLLDLRQRTDDLTESLEYQTPTSDLLEVISRSTADIQPVVDNILLSAGRLCDAKQLGIALRYGDVFRFLATTGVSAEVDLAMRTHEYRIDRSSVIGRVALYGAVVHLGDAQADPDYATPSTSVGGLHSILGVPLLRDGEVAGVIVAARDRVEAFAERQIALLKTFADQAVIAMENARLLGELRESLDQQTAMADVLGVINTSGGDITPVFDAMVDKATTLCGAPHGALFSWDGEYLLTVSTRHNPQDPNGFLLRPIRVNPGTMPQMVRVLREGRTVQDPDLAQSQAYRTRVPLTVFSVEQIGIHTMLMVPLVSEHGSVGLFALYRLEVKPFTDKQIALIEAFAQQAVVAMENARLLNELRQRTDDLTESLEYQTATSELLEVISRSGSNIQPVMDTILAAAARLCGTTSGAVAIRRDGVVHVMAVMGVSTEVEAALRERNHTDQRTLTGRTVLAGRVLHVDDLAADADYSMPEIVRIAHMRTALGVPLLRDGESIGAIVVSRNHVEPFSERQIALIRTFADQAVIAMENARLLSELRESLDQQTATADILRVIASSPEDVQPVFEAIAERSNKLVDGLSTAVYRLVDDMQHLMSFTPTNPEADAALRAMFPAPLPPIFSEAVRMGEIFRIADSEVEFANAPAFRELARLRGWRSVLMVPLLQDGRAIGLITVTRVEPGLFEDQHVELLKTFADQAVIAISNVGLFQEVQQRTRELSASLEDLRAAQSRLIQSEKLASLGQLTAGIAHEIKNPLNFVNNFAGLSGELLQELKETMDSAIAALSAEVQAEIDEVIDTLSSNLAKIVEHGKRADGIVRSMLEHSRSSTGECRGVDVNGLVEEALNLAYHGARAQDQSFSITLKKEFGVDIAPIELVPQDMTRVFLNLFSNGFYATRKRLHDGRDGAYRPTLRVSTRDVGEAVEIRVRDNGTGIAPDVRAKLFQPFFTTKPTGEGTGLGLSISYDIVTQQHGGAIEVDSEPGQFTEFTVRLPRARRAAPAEGA